MRIISYKTLREASKKHPDLKQSLDDWYEIASKANWNSLEDVRKVFPHADAVGNFTIFNIKGNRYRLIVGIDYIRNTIFIKYVLTHAEYDKDAWKNDPHF
ncbi:MAG: type II toxin-antitoxin system HigB family toxin [Halothece sp.]